MASFVPACWPKPGSRWQPQAQKLLLSTPTAAVGLNEVVAGGSVLTGGSIQKLDTEGTRYLETELWDGLLGAQISVVKQP